MKHPERPPVIEASEKTAFIYRIEGGMDDRDMDEMEAMDSGYVLGRNWPTIVSESVDIGHRMRYMRKRTHKMEQTLQKELQSETKQPLTLLTSERQMPYLNGIKLQIPIYSHP